MERETEIEPGSSFHYLGGESSKRRAERVRFASIFFFFFFFLHYLLTQLPFGFTDWTISTISLQHAHI